MLREETVPSPGPGEVRVETIASAVSAGTEMLVYRGEVPQDLPLDLPTLRGSYAFPIKYGYAVAGRVLDTGSNAGHLYPGDPVFVHHPHQEVFVVPATMLVRLPDDLDPLLGVFAANLETALNVVHDTPLSLGETALVLGAGVVGLLVARLLKLAGAGAVLVVDPLERRRKLALAAGADGCFRARRRERARHGSHRWTWGGRGRRGQRFRGCIAGCDRGRGDRGDGRRGLVVRYQAHCPRSRGTLP